MSPRLRSSAPSISRRLLKECGRLISPIPRNESFAIAPFALITCAAVLAAPLSQGAQGDVTTLLNNGSSLNRVDMVYLGDGYTASQQAQYANDVSAIAANFFGGGALADPYPRYSKFFNVHRVEVVSAQSGADHPLQNIYVNTALGTAYGDTVADERALYLNNGDAAANALLPENTGKGFSSDLRVVAVNDAQYGGAATFGGYAVLAAGDANRLETALHEVGHSFARLADEYGDYDDNNLTVYRGTEPTERNVTADPAGAKWARWLGYNDGTLGTVGAYEEAMYHDQGLYRSTETSKMRELNNPFNAVSKEAIISTIYDFVRPLDAYLDNTARITAIADPGAIQLWITSVDANVFTKEWYIDGNLIAGVTGESFDPYAYITTEGAHSVSVKVFDGTDMVRDPGILAKMQQTVAWTIDYSVALDGDGDYVLKNGTLAIRLQGEHGLKKTTADTATISGANTFTHDVNVLAGRLVVANATALGTGATIVHTNAVLDIAAMRVGGISSLILNGGTVTGTTGSLSAAAFDLRTGTVEATLAGTGAATKSTSGTVIVRAAQTYTGGTIIQAGTLRAAHERALSTGTVLVDGGILDIAAAVSGSGAVTLASGSITGTTGSLSAGSIEVQSGSVSASLSGQGALTKTTAGTVTLSGNNSFTGGVSVQAGTLVATGNGSLGAGDVNVTGGALSIAEKDAAKLATLHLDGGVMSFDSKLTTATLGAITGAADFAITTGGGARLALTVGASNASTTYSGNLSGVGSLLNKDGTGTLTLSGANSYTGGTVVSAGKLAVANANALSTGAVTVKGGILDVGTFIVSGLSAVTIESGTITGTTGGSLSASTFNLKGGIVSIELTGTGALAKTGTGTATLAAINTYTGGTTVTEGTLLVTKAGALSSGAVLINGGTLDVKSTAVIAAGGITLDSGVITGATGSLSAPSYDLRSGTVSAKLTGPASLEKTSAGTVTLASANTTKGAVNVNGGTLAITNAAALGSGVTNVAAGATLRVGDNTKFSTSWAGSEVRNNGTVELRLSSETTVTRAISGTGDLVQNGTGTVILANAFYTGSTTVNSGTLVLPENRLPSGTLSTNGAGTLDIRTDSGTSDFTHGVTGDGTLAFSGAGTARLHGDVAFAGQMQVAPGGSLSLGSSSDERVTLSSRLLSITQGARLAGSGSIAGSLNNAGTLAPGFSPGTITIAGDFTNTGTLEMQVAANGAHDEIRYAGQAFLGGKLVVSYLDGTPHRGTVVSFLTDTDTSDGKVSLVGDFASVVTPGGIIYATGTGLNFVVGGSILDLPGVSLPQRDRLTNFANALSAAGTTNATLAAITSAVTTGATASATGATATTQAARLATLVRDASPLGLAAGTGMPIAQAAADTEELYRHLNARRFERRGSWFTEPSPYIFAKGMTSDADDSEDGRAFNYRSVGGAAGFDVEHDEQLTLGAQVAYDSGKAEFHHGSGRLNQDHARMTAYASYIFGGKAFVDAGLFGGASLYDSFHNTVLGKNRGDTFGWEGGAFTNVGFLLVLTKNLNLTPHAGFTYTHAAVAGFDESGNALALKVNDYTQDSLAARLGSGINYMTKLGGYSVRVGLDAAWVHECLDIETDIGGSIAGAGFTTAAVASLKDRVEVGPEIDLGLTETRSITASYKFDYAFGDATGHRFDIGYRTRF